MKSVLTCTLAVALIALACVSFLQHSPATVVAAPPAVAQVSAAYGALPLSFEANQGQTDRQVQYLSRGNGYSLFLTSREAVLALQPAARAKNPPAVLRMQLVGANRHPQASASEPLAGKSAYFVGANSGRWQAEIPQYARVMYRDVFPGVDLTYYGQQGQLEYDFILAPGADPNRIRLGFEGADQLRLEKGEVVLQVAGGDVRLHQPALYQEKNGAKTKVDGSFVLASAREIAFQVGPYDKSQALVIDPGVEYSTYLGGSAVEKAHAIAVDRAGNAYVVGSSASADFPTTAGAMQPRTRTSGSTAFVAKLNPAGTAILYSTYLGGTHSDTARAVAVNEKGEAFVAGSTRSPDFPVTPGARQTHLGGSQNGFVARLSADGSRLLYATYLGGSGEDEVRGLAINAAGEAHVAGITNSKNFPTTAGAMLRNLGCAIGATCTHGFAAKLSADGAALHYSTLLGGRQRDYANGIALDLSGAAYIAGHTHSPDFPVSAGALNQVTNHSACGTGRTCADVFVTKLSSTGAMLYSARFGGSADQHANAIAVDRNGAAYLAGRTDSRDFPVAGRPFMQAALNYGGSAFVSRINPLGTKLEFSTYLGGGNGDEANAIAVDAAGRVHVAGSTSSTLFPTTVGAFQRRLNGASGAFFSTLDEAGGSLMYSTLMSGSGSDSASGMAVDAADNVYLAGSTDSRNFPVKQALRGTLTGQGGAFVTKFAISAASVGSLTPPSLNFSTPFGTTSAPQAATLKNSGTTNLTISSITIGGTNPGSFAFQTPAPVGACSTATVLATNATCTLDMTFTPPNASGQSANVTVVDNAINSPQVLGLTGQGTGAFPVYSATSLTFTNQAPSTTSAAKTVTLTNNGDAAMTGIVITKTGTNAANFTLATTPATNCGGSLGSGGTCTISVTFKPTAGGANTAALSVASSAFNSPNGITLLGNPPTGVLSPATMPFGTIATGAIAKNQIAILTNTAQFTPLAITSLVASANYQQLNNCPVGGNLAPQTTCTITVSFTPTVVQSPLNGSITITDNNNNVTNAKQKITTTGASTASASAVVSPTSLVFGSVLQASPVNVSPAKTVVLTNKGSTTLGGIFPQLSSTDFAVVTAATNPCSSTLGAGLSCNFAVVFQPQLTNFTGVRPAVLTIFSNAGGVGSQNLVAMTGTATGIPLGQVCASGTNCVTSLTFPDTVQANPTNASPQQVVTVKNTGTIPLTVNNFFFTNGPDFQIGIPASNACTAGIKVNPGATCNIAATFNPTLTRITGTRSDILRVQVNHNNINNTEFNIAVNGNAIGVPTMALSAASLNFPNTALASTSARQTITVTNNGNNPLIINGISVRTGDFQLPAPASGACPLGGVGLAPSSSCSIDVLFSPGGTAGGPRSDILLIQNNGGNFTNTFNNIRLTGLATGGATQLTIGIAPTALNFGNQLFGTLSGPKVVTVTNTNSVVMNISVGTEFFANDWRVAGSCTGQIQPNATCTIFVNFSPTILGPHNDDLVIFTSVTGASAQQRLPLLGTGTGSISLVGAPTPVTFATPVPQGGFSVSQPVVITNNGTAPAIVSAIYVSAGLVNAFSANVDFQQINNCPIGGRLLPGASCVVNVFFNPSANTILGARTGNLVVQSLNAGVNTLGVVPLTGTASGTPVATISPASITFPLDQSVNQQGVQQQITVSNTGDAPLVVSQQFASNGEFGFSSFSTTCFSGTLPPGASCNIYTVFGPGTPGNRLGHYVIRSNSGNTNSQQAIPLSGFATP
jgi:hypothetical protein